MKKCLLWILLLCVLLTGCAQDSPMATLPPVYIVRFEVAGVEQSVQYIEEGYFPEQITARAEGISFVGWLDENGEAVDPFATPVYKSVTYVAQPQMAITDHARFLFLDEQGNLRPDDPLTADALYLALEALSPRLVSYFPDMPRGDTPVDADTLWQVLSVFFPDAEPAFSGSDYVTRAQFASRMVVLLGRDQEKLQVNPQCVLPGDVYANRADLAALYEASVSHRPVTEGGGWEQVKAPLQYEPGLLCLDGWLYCVGQDRQFVTNADVGSFHFGPDGRYTSGNAQLDSHVARVLGKIQSEDPNAQSITLLRRAYEYCRDNIGYLYTVHTPSAGQTGWQIPHALTAFEAGEGVSYHHAGAFWALARGLGYEATVVSGPVLEGDQVRGWVTIPIDGQTYIFDSQWEWDYRENWGQDDADMFMISQEESVQWDYEWTP